VNKKGLSKGIFFQRLCSGLLFLVFFSIPSLQAFHHHNIPSSKLEGKAYLYSNANCPTCDYLAHQQGKQFYLEVNPETPVYLANPIEIIIDFNCKILKSSLPGFTNKGPPINS